MNTPRPLQFPVFLQAGQLCAAEHCSAAQIVL